jgi:hypothetical protein
MRGIGLFAFATVALAIYLISPYFALYRIDHAVRDGDTLRLERYADWPAIREQLRADLKGLALETVTKQTANNDTAGSLASGLAMLMVPAVVDRMVDANVNPDGVIRALNDGTKGTPRKSLRDLVAYAFFESPTEFRVDLRNPHSPDGPKITALLELSGSGWRVTRVKLPLSDISKAIAEARQHPDTAAAPKSDFGANAPTAAPTTFGLAPPLRSPGPPKTTDRLLPQQP